MPVIQIQFVIYLRPFIRSRLYPKSPSLPPLSAPLTEMVCSSSNTYPNTQFPTNKTTKYTDGGMIEIQFTVRKVDYCTFNK